MSGIVYVSPQVYLVSKDKWKSDHQKPGYVPILSADIPRFLQSLQRLSKLHRDEPGTDGVIKVSAEQGVALSNTHGSSQAAENQNSDSGKYQNLKHFFPIGLQQQLHTFSLQGVPSTISDEVLELALQTCLQRIIQWLGHEKGPTVECWTNIRFSDLSTQDVFVRMDQSNDLLYAMICKSLAKLFPPSDEQDRTTVEFHCDSNTWHFIEDKQVGIPQEGCEGLSEEVNQLLKEPKGSSAGRGTNDEIYQGESTDYQIDFNTLSDLPRESLSQLCKDIIEFRTRVVSMEKEKRIRESYEESKRRKHQMMRVFDQLKKSKSHLADADDMESDDTDDEQDEGEGVDEDSFTAEKQRQEREKEESDNRYQEILENLHKQVEPRLAALHRDIVRQQNYESTLAEERPLHLKQLLHQAGDPYYDHRRSFKQAEEEKDAADRKQHGSEAPSVAPEVQPDTKEEAPASEEITPAPAQIKIKFALKKAIDTSAQNLNNDDDGEVDHPATRTENAEISTKSAPSVLDLDDETLEKCLQRIKESRVVDELVKEYLGVYEDELVEYIFENVREHKSKQVLLDDLKETFDDDAITIVDKVWSDHYWH